MKAQWDGIPEDDAMVANSGGSTIAAKPETKWLRNSGYYVHMSHVLAHSEATPPEIRNQKSKIRGCALPWVHPVGWFPVQTLSLEPVRGVGGACPSTLDF